MFFVVCIVLGGDYPTFFVVCIVLGGDRVIFYLEGVPVCPYIV
jgi:hypothetical protein